MNQSISPKFPFESKFIEIKGSKMHYIDVGKGDTGALPKSGRLKPKMK